MIAALVVMTALGQAPAAPFVPPPPIHVVAGQAPRVIVPVGPAGSGSAHGHGLGHKKAVGPKYAEEYGHAPAPDTAPGWFQHGGRGFILPPGPGDGYGFPNGAPDGYGWYGAGTLLPLGADRTPEYYFPRYFTVPLQTMFFPNYYNPHTTRGQHYLPYAGCGGGIHPASAPVIGLSRLPVTPYSDMAESGPSAPVPSFGGEVEATPVAPGESDLIP